MDLPAPVHSACNSTLGCMHMHACIAQNFDGGQGGPGNSFLGNYRKIPYLLVGQVLGKNFGLRPNHQPTYKQTIFVSHAACISQVADISPSMKMKNTLQIVSI